MVISSAGKRDTIFSDTQPLMIGGMVCVSNPFLRIFSEQFNTVRSKILVRLQNLFILGDF